ncbi:hypothetical protein DL765_006332 [Monosporascus sp. GIB2]|nr:hypothetical protein DL765_006332 [Monosporascus sp. GIB2]
MKSIKALSAIVSALTAVVEGVPPRNSTEAVPGSGFSDSCIHGGIYVQYGKPNFFSACKDGDGLYVTSMIDLNKCYGYDTSKDQLVSKKDGNFQSAGCYDCDVPDDDHTLRCTCKGKQVTHNLNTAIGNDLGILSCWGTHGVPLLTAHH